MAGEAVASPDAASDRAGEVPRDLLLRVTMTRAVKGARSRRVCRGCPERPSQEVSDGWLRCSPTAGKGQRRARARARNPTWSAVKASDPIAGTARRLTAERASPLGFADVDRGHGGPVVRNERKAGICSGLPIDEASARRSWRADRGASQASEAPPALRTPLAKGQRKAKEEANSEWRVANREGRVEWNSEEEK
jgi:hypothetical protein